MKKLLILDSNSILNRAFYGIKFLSASDGTPTNAIYGFLNILLKLINDEKPDYICAAFDLKAPTFRHKMYKEYKAQRKPMPDGLKEQMPIAKELVKAMGIPLLELEGYEADDIIGTVSGICEQENTECLIATGDKDDLQLVTKLTKVILTVSKQGNTETVIYDDDAVVEKYGVTPLEFIDVKALMGDKSDNIPGVAGIGEKTAVKLIAVNHSIEKIYEDVENCGAKGAMLEKLKNGKEMAYLSKELATINKNVPIEFSFKNCEFSGFRDENGEIYLFLKKLELNSVIKRMGLKAVCEETVDYFADLCEVSDIKELDLTKDIFCYFEFFGKNIMSAALSDGKKTWAQKTGMSISETELIERIKDILEDDKIKKIVFDKKEALVNFNKKIDLKNAVGDITIAAYLVDPSRTEYKISDLTEAFLGTVISAEKNEEAQFSLLEDEVDEKDERLLKCGHIMAHLWKKLSEKMQSFNQMDLYYNIELPLTEVLADMKISGFCVDKQELKSFGDKLDVGIKALTEEIYMISGEEFNINSPKQLGVILFEKFNLPVIKKTKTGYSTNAEVLGKLLGKHPVIEKIIEYRQLTKLKSTYCDGMIGLIDDTGRIHSIFNQTVTVTGRISSTEPNLQNIPTRTELGRELRKMFIAPDDEYVLVDADYSQIELRVLAHIADDEVMKNAFSNNEDIHTVTASQVFHVPVDMVTKEQRSSAKAVNFGIVYGIGDFSLAQDLKIPVKLAKEYIENYLGKYTGVKEYMSRIKEQAKRDGYVKTLMNRIRFIPEIQSSNFNVRSFGERVALNTPIQGTAADIIKLAMVKVVRRMKQEGLKSRLILQVHDELIVEALKSEEALVRKILKEEMEGAMELSVPLVVDMSSGKRWYDAK